MMSNQTSDLPLVGDKLGTNPFVDLTEDYKVLEWYDGPLLSCARFPGNPQWYVLHWADVDSRCNRWIVYDVSPTDLDVMANKDNTSTCREIISRSKELYLLDIDNEFQHVATYRVTFNELDSYGVLPAESMTYGNPDSV